MMISCIGFHCQPVEFQHLDSWFMSPPQFGSILCVQYVYTWLCWLQCIVQQLAIVFLYIATDKYIYLVTIMYMYEFNISFLLYHAEHMQLLTTCWPWLREFLKKIFDVHVLYAIFRSPMEDHNHAYMAVTNNYYKARLLLQSYRVGWCGIPS